MDGSLYDTVIIGGGPAGLSAALVLGRCMRRALLCDSGRYRNERSQALHCYMGHDGMRRPSCWSAQDASLNVTRRSNSRAAWLPGQNRTGKASWSASRTGKLFAQERC